MIALLLEAVYAFCMLAFMGIMNDGSTLVIPVLPWMVLLCIEYYLEIAFLKKPRSKTWYYLLNGSFYVLNTAVLIAFIQMGRTGELFAVYYSGISGVGSYILIAGASLIVSIRLPILILKEFTDQAMLVHFEGAVLFSIVYFLVMESGTTLPLTGTICAVGAPILAMLTLTAMRGGRRGQGMARNTVQSVGVWISGGIFFLLLFWSMLARDSVNAVSKGAVSFGNLILGGIYRGAYSFFYWLFSLLPHMELGEYNADGAEVSIDLSGADTSVGYDFSWIIRDLAIIAGIVLVIGIVVVLVKSRKSTSQVVILGNVSERGADEKRSGELLIHRMIRELRFTRFYRKNKKNAMGAYILLTRYGKRHGRPMERGMTVREYVSDFGRELPEVEDYLTRLADALDEFFYGSGDTSVLEVADTVAFCKHLQQRK